MSRQTVNIGAVANDTTGDTLRQAGNKINANFAELYTSLYGDSVTAINTLTLGNNAIIFEGSAADSWETTLTVINPTADRTIRLPDYTGNVVVDSATQTLLNKTLKTPSFTAPKIKDADSSHSYTIVPANLAANRNLNLPLLSDSDTIVVLSLTQTLTNKTLTSPFLVSPKIDSTIQDSSGNPLIGHTATPSAVNYIQINNAAAGGHPGIEAVGASTNINLTLTGKGTGATQVRSRFNLISETLTAGTAVSTISPTTIFNHATPEAFTLANGTTEGDVKKFINRGAGEARITPATFPYTGKTKFTLKQFGAVEAVWASTGWFLLGLDSSHDSSARYMFIS
jgi:Bacteriophage T4 gp9/10-like protein